MPEAEGQEAVERGESMDELVQHYGFKNLHAAIDAQVAARVEQLTNLSVRESVGEYERTIGEIRGLQMIDQLIAGIRAIAAEEATNG